MHHPTVICLSWTGGSLSPATLETLFCAAVIMFETGDEEIEITQGEITAEVTTRFRTISYGGMSTTVFAARVTANGKLVRVHFLVRQAECAQFELDFQSIEAETKPKSPRPRSSSIYLNMN